MLRDSQSAFFDKLNVSKRGIVKVASSQLPTGNEDTLRADLNKTLKAFEKSPDVSKNMLEKVLHDYCKIFALITLRDMAQGNRLDYAYHIKLKRGKRNDDFINALKKIETINGVHLLMQEKTVEL